MKRFRMPAFGWTLCLLLVFSPVLLPLVKIGRMVPGEGDFLTGVALPFLLLFAAALAYSRTVFVLDVQAEGLILYRVNRVAWSDVLQARRRTVLFLPYLVLKRRHGGRWWVPLYFSGEGSVRDALRTAAPPGHPIREALP